MTVGAPPLPAGAPPTAPDAPDSDPGTDARVLEVLRRHGDHTSAFLAAIAYRSAARRHVAQLCGPFTAVSDKSRLLSAFRDFAASRGWRIAAAQLRRTDAELYAADGFTVNQLGCSFGIDLHAFTLRGTRFVKTRNKIARASRLGVEVEELTAGELRRPEIQRELARVDSAWLRAKGRHVQELAFMVGQRGGRGGAHRRLFLARHRGRGVAYVTYSPCFGSRAGWLYDLTRRDPVAPPGTIELIFHTALSKFQAESCRWLHLGLTPLVGISREHELSASASRTLHTLFRALGARGGALYPARSQEAFKLKWSPRVVEPEYVAFEGRVTLGAVAHLGRLTRAIPL